MALSGEAFGEYHEATYGETLKLTTWNSERSGEAFGENQTPVEVAIEDTLHDPWANSDESIDNVIEPSDDENKDQLQKI